MSIARKRGVCLHCGHDHDADDALLQAALRKPAFVASQSRPSLYPEMAKPETAASSTREPVLAEVEVYECVRLRAEGSDWKRDSGETLAAWVWRTLGTRSAIACGEVTDTDRYEEIKDILMKGGSIHYNPHTFVWTIERPDGGCSQVQGSLSTILDDGIHAATDRTGVQK